MTQRRDPLGLLDIFWRDMERIFGARRGSEEGNPGAAAEPGNPGPAAGGAGNPVEVAMPPVPPEFNSNMTGLLERKRQEWLAAGASPCLVRMGLNQAVSGAQGLARRMEMFAREVDKPAVMQDYIDNVADAWVRAMVRSDEERRGDAL